MANVQIKALIDWDGDGTFSHALSDVTSDLISANWRSGIVSYKDRFPADGTAHLEVERRGNFYPGLAILKPMRQVKIQVWDGAAWETMWTGYTQSFEFSTTAANAQTITIVCNQGLDKFFELDREIPLLQDVTVDQVLTEILVGGYWTPPGAEYISHLGNITLGTTALYGADSAFNFLETGQVVFDWVGEGWSSTEPKSIFNGIKELIRIERGWLILNREGKLDFYNRYYLPQASLSPVASLDLDTNTHNATLDYATNYANQVIVSYSLFEPDENVTTLAEYPDTLKIEPYTTKSLRIPIEDEGSKRPVSVVSLDIDAMQQAHTVTRLSDGTTVPDSIVRVSGYIKNSLVYLTLYNRANYTVSVKGIAVKGTTLKRQQAKYSAEYSPDIVDLRRVVNEKFSLPTISNEEMAQTWADYELGERLARTSEFTSVTIKYDDNINLLKSIKPGATVTITDSANGLTALPHFVLGEDFRATPNNLEVTYRTFYSKKYGIGIVGISELDTETYII